MLGFPLGILSAAGAGGVAGDYELIESVILGTDTASVTFSSLATYASTYKHLQLRYVGRDSVSDDANRAFSLRLNADSGENYVRHGLHSNGSTVASGAVLSQTNIMGFETSLGSSSTEVFAAGIVDILDFANTSKNKTIKIFSGVAQTQNGINLISGLYLSTSAVTSIEIGARLGFAGSLGSGSRFSLYGIKG